MSELPTTISPLQGKRVLVTRTREQAAVLSERLRALGAVPVELPAIRIEPPRDWRQLDAALQRLYADEGERYDWLIFTSVNGVTICLDRLRTLGREPRAMRQVRIAAIGPATAAALQRYGLTADLVPGAYIAEAVAAALREDAQRRGRSLMGLRILLARAAEARKVLVTELRSAGAIVDEVAAYTTAAVSPGDERGREGLRLLQQQELAILTFTSSSTVRNFVAWLKGCELSDGSSALDLVMHTARHTARPVIACIGPITARTARELGLQVDVEAQEFTIDGLVEAMVQFFKKGKQETDDRANC
ncbi:MAG: uroporphyrinogen-III synthase [Ktedonobacteraceae bacterium]|nr:uroporphyrinogen-III synthase [Ktedonobacteraceae bacterium]